MQSCQFTLGSDFYIALHCFITLCIGKTILTDKISAAHRFTDEVFPVIHLLSFSISCCWIRGGVRLGCKNAMYYMRHPLMASSRDATTISLDE